MHCSDGICCPVIIKEKNYDDFLISRLKAPDIHHLFVWGLAFVESKYHPHMNGQNAD